MVKFETALKKFANQGEKTGWTYIEIPADLAGKLKPGVRTSFRVKGKLDKHVIKGVAMIPMGGGSFIIPVNAAMRKALAKKQGAMLTVQLTADTEPFRFNPDFIECLKDDPPAKAYFETLSGSHQRYFSKWIDSAKTDQTKAKRIANAVTALSRKWGYGEMLRGLKADKDELRG